MMAVRSLLKCTGIALALAAAFWFVDMPQTVRLKTSIVKLLPLGPKTTNDMISKLCRNAIPDDRGAQNCFFANYDEIDAKWVELCNIVNAHMRNHPNEWRPSEAGDYAIYFGNDPMIIGTAKVVDFESRIIPLNDCE